MKKKFSWKIKEVYELDNNEKFEFFNNFDYEEFNKNFFNKYNVFDDIKINYIQPNIGKTIIKNYDNNEKEEILKQINFLKYQISICNKCSWLNKFIWKSDKEKTMAWFWYWIPYKTVYFAYWQSLHSYNKRNKIFQIEFKWPLPKKDSWIILYNALNKAWIIEKQNLYVSNVVKCHPIWNRPSNKIEIKNCSPFLLNEIKFINPLVLITIWWDSWKFINNFWININKDIKEIFKWKFWSLFKLNKNLNFANNIKYIIKLYHPSYINRIWWKKEDILEFENIINKSNKYIIEDLKKEMKNNKNLENKYIIAWLWKIINYQI